MNDKAIRPLLRNQLKDFHLVEEVCSGDTRIDVLGIGSEEKWLNGFEIKGKTDSLKLLPNQIKQYELVCLGNFLVTYENHLKRAMLILPEYWGLYVVRQRDDVGIIEELRDAKPHRNLDTKAMLGLLWGDELRTNGLK